MHDTIRQSDIPTAHLWQGRTLSPVEEVLFFHEQPGARKTFDDLLQNLLETGIDYALTGSLAVSLHGSVSVVPDIQVCVRAADIVKFRERFVGHHYQSVEGRSRRFLDPPTNVTFVLLVCGELAGRTSRNKVIRFPDPSEAIEVKGLRTVPLPRLIELKLVTWRYKDWGDVVELIRANNLDEAFAEQLNPLVRMAYLECYDQKMEEDKYEQQRDEQ